jgi:valyl-tRNA synthetase
MIIAGYEYKHERPFENVYFTGIVRDELGRKMSKSLGNSPDLLALIEKYGADAVRFGTIISSPAGNDLLFDVKEESTLKQGSFFINKIWNAMKLVKMWENRISENETATQNFAVNWFEQRLNEVKNEIEKLYQQFRLSEALKTIYSLVWDDFCSWYLEWIKPGYEQPVDAFVYNKTIFFFEELLQLLHPFMPFVTEEMYHLLRQQEDDICIKQNQDLEIKVNEKILEQGASLKNIISAIRDARNKNNIKPKEVISLYIQSNADAYKNYEEILLKQVNADSLTMVSENVAGTIVVAVEKDKFFIKSNTETNTVALKNDLEKDLAYQRNFLQSVLKKLSNERFVQNAKPEVVAMERKKQADAEARIKTLEESIENLG